MPMEPTPAYGGDAEENEQLMAGEDVKSYSDANATEIKKGGRIKPKSQDTYLLVLHWLGVVLLCGYFGYAAGMLFGFSHRDEHGLRVIITYSFMMGFSFLLFLSEYRVACVTKNIGFVNNSFGMAMFYFMLAVFALIDDVAWWKWVLFGSMSSMSAAYIIGASCAHKTDDENDPVYAEYSPPRAVDKEV
eukprot:CAMPEP_0114509414 /NCGR_PEP_ID=MMETSP0109-20121206/13199_1 /TAXON_ID=29199 /ORGANISM="Chlorarachnion reptans, Strain CCCM449" /LENGTH=188 /DNA_ID=CAMNT_0001688569 /DNA_START=47 /DNA_END=613 /DNA_ORIENTATION=+